MGGVLYVPSADTAGLSDREPASALTPGKVDWLICFVSDSPDGGTISPPPLDSCNCRNWPAVHKVSGYDGDASRVVRCSKTANITLAEFHVKREARRFQ